MSPSYTTEPNQTVPEFAASTVCWRAIFAGSFVTFLVYIGFMAASLIFGGANLEQYVRGEETARTIGMGMAVWTIVAGLVALYLGGHVAGRAGGLISTRVGRYQGLVIAAIFFTVMLTQLGMVVGALGGGITSAFSSISGGLTNAATSNVGRDMIEDATQGLQFKAPVSEVAQGVASRLMRGNDEAATRYLAAQAGISPDDAQARLNVIKAQITEYTRQGAETAARGIRNGGLVLLLSIIFGSLAAMAGGGIAANYNLREPVSEVDFKATRARLAHI